MDLTGCPTLSVVMPTHNEAAALPETLSRVIRALDDALWPVWEIVVVDDGSTDDTVAKLAAMAEPRLRVVSQTNQGRMPARRRGLDEATGELVLFLDSRVWVGDDALRFMRAQLAADPAARIWNGHAITLSDARPWTRFWDAITFLAWRGYLRNPTTTSYGAEDFDHFPKGTTMFLAPRAWLIEASDGVESLSSDPALANDDTLMIRALLDHGRIHISPEFDCYYRPRQTLDAFLRSAYHRGSVFVDGHLRPGMRFHRPFQLLCLVLPLGGLWACRRPRRLLAVGVGGSAALGVGARAAGVPTADAVALGLLATPFSAAYGAGIIRGFRRRRR